MNPPSTPLRRYRWPWFVLAAFILAIVLAVLWMRHEIERARFLRDINSPPPEAPAGPKSTNSAS